MEYTKQYPNGQLLTIHDDGASPKEVLKATLAKVYTATDGAKYAETIMEGTDNDLTSEIDALVVQISQMQNKVDMLIARRGALRAELAKLPARAVAEVKE